MPTLHVCPICHGETAQLIYCELYAAPVCSELCALTPAELHFLELVSGGAFAAPVS